MAMAGHEVLAMCVDMTTVRSAGFSAEPDRTRRPRIAASSLMKLACVSCQWAVPGEGLTRL
eukprot:5140693-Prymnesium_polylepis.1